MQSNLKGTFKKNMGSWSAGSVCIFSFSESESYIH